MAYVDPPDAVDGKKIAASGVLGATDPYSFTENIVNAIKALYDLLTGDEAFTVDALLKAGAGLNVKVQLGDNAGATKLSILDSDDAEVASIDSNGNLTLAGSGSGGANYDTDNVSNPPTEAELESALDTPADWGRKIAHVNDNNLAQNEYLALTDGAAFWVALLAKARLAATAATATNAASAQTTPTYDGGGQAVHPSVYYNPDGWGTGSKKYWMALTPYPGGDSDYENPSILSSDDGDTWAVPAGLTNPIDAKPAGGYNSDPEIVVDSSGVMWLFYREGVSPTADYIRLRSSSDGVTWSDEAALFSGSYAGLVSPTVVYDGTQWVMWYIDTTVASPNALKKRTCATPDGAWSAASTCTVNNVPAGKDLWHISVVKRGSEYHAFVVLCNAGTNGTAGELWFASSTDGDTWTVTDSVLIDQGAGGQWDDGIVYRASAVPTPTGYDLWYSAQDGTNWHIGRTTVTLDSLLLANLSRLVQIRDTKANIEAFGGTLEETAISYATDTGQFGIYTGGAWQWFTSGVTDHGALSGRDDDDHTQYQLRTEKGAANGYAGLGATGYVPHDQLGSGGGGSAKFLREDNTWQTVSSARREPITNGSKSSPELLFLDGDVIMMGVS